MAKGLRSNRKKAVRTLRRNEVAASKLYQDREAAIQGRLAATLEAGRAARELAEQARAAEARAAEAVDPPAGKGEGMEVDEAGAVPAKKQRGVLLTKKKHLKLQKQRKGKRAKLAVQSLYKRTAKGKKRKGGG